MYLHSIRIKGFRKHFDTRIELSASTFLIGENNTGKSSVLKAIEYLLSQDKAGIDPAEFYSARVVNSTHVLADEIVLEGEFRNLPLESREWQGFGRGRLFNYDVPEGLDESGLCVFYRRRYPRDGKFTIEMKSRAKNIKVPFVNCKTYQDYIDNGLDASVIDEIFPGINYSDTLKKPQKDILHSIDVLYDFEDGEGAWDENPAGIQSIVPSKLPKFLLIPAKDSTDEITGGSGTLQKTLLEIFSVIKERSEHFKKAQEHLDLLAKELDPTQSNSDASKMIGGINDVLEEIFPGAGFEANATLSKADSLKPSFGVQMYSNITTDAKLQGTGLVRSAVFALLRYKNERDIELAKKGSSYMRPLIIGFEEPEIYLHPNAINKMRDVIYDLASGSAHQIICTTHSPFMIDLSKRPRQILSSLRTVKGKKDVEENEVATEAVECVAFNVSEAYTKLVECDKAYLKMLLRVDDSISKAFFVPNVLIVEGDTEEVVLKETIRLLPAEFQSLRSEILSEWQIVRARGKSSIIALVNYLKAMGISPYVMHDSDTDTPGAYRFNESIRKAVDDDSRITICENCIEDMLGYKSPSSEKPYTAYNHISEHWNDWDSIPDKWTDAFERIFVKGRKLKKRHTVEV